MKNALIDIFWLLFGFLSTIVIGVIAFRTNQPNPGIIPVRFWLVIAILILLFKFRTASASEQEFIGIRLMWACIGVASFYFMTLSGIPLVLRLLPIPGLIFLRIVLVFLTRIAFILLEKHLTEMKRRIESKKDN